MKRRRFDTLAELREYEASLAVEVNELPHGPSLFLVNPLRLLAELGVELSPEAVRELERLEPTIARGSDFAYDAIRAQDARAQPPVRFVLGDRLFRPDEEDAR